MQLRGTSALITGASRGLGAALARELAAAGVRVALVARTQTDLDRVVAELRAAGGDAHGVVGDVADKFAVHGIAATAAAVVGPIDLLVHNAGTLGPTPLRALLDTDCEDLERALDVNVVGPFRLSKIVAGSMALRGHGTIAHVTSDAAVEAYPTWGAYAISKAALEHLGRSLAVELQDTGVRIWNVDPGEMDTQMHRDALPDADPATLSRPADIARRFVRLLAEPQRWPSGARIDLLRAEAA